MPRVFGFPRLRRTLPAPTGPRRRSARSRPRPVLVLNPDCRRAPVLLHQHSCKDHQTNSLTNSLTEPNSQLPAVIKSSAVFSFCKAGCAATRLCGESRPRPQRWCKAAPLLRARSSVAIAPWQRTLGAENGRESRVPARRIRSLRGGARRQAAPEGRTAPRAILVAGTLLGTRARG